MDDGGVSLERFEREGGVLLVLSGQLDAGNPGALARLLEGQARAVSVDLAELELDGPAAVLEAVEVVRTLLAGSGTLTLLHSPQLLAHTLYRVGLLEGAALELVDTRQEEPYG